MAYLFEIRDKQVYPNAEALLITPFKEIWERDNFEGKEVALQEFAYIEFVSSMKKSNPYKGYPESIKAQKVKEAVIKIDDWEPDDLVEMGIEMWKDFQKNASATYPYYVAAKVAAEKMQRFFLEVDINQKHPRTGMPIYKPRDITSALNDTEKVLTNLTSLKKKVEEELFETTKTKSGKAISPFANPDSLK